MHTRPSRLYRSSTGSLVAVGGRMRGRTQRGCATGGCCAREAVGRDCRGEHWFAEWFGTSADEMVGRSVDELLVHAPGDLFPAGAGPGPWMMVHARDRDRAVMVSRHPQPDGDFLVIEEASETVPRVERPAPALRAGRPHPHPAPAGDGLVDRVLLRHDGRAPRGDPRRHDRACLPRRDLGGLPAGARRNVCGRRRHRRPRRSVRPSVASQVRERSTAG